MQLQPDTLLQGRYRVGQLIAQGGMGAVYRATDERLGNSVALKQTLVSDPQLRAAFEREARLLAGLHHPALPVVSDHFAEGSEQFLVMQFIPGDDLAGLLQRRGAPFPLAEVLPWADRLLDALDYLHTQRPPIVHRDIKPQNLKLTARGEIILLDFGLAKGEPGQGTAARSIFGYTPQYAPIEQIQGAGTDPRSDLYAVGATLYQLLTAEAPPDALTRAAAAVDGRADPLRPAHALNPDLPPSLAELLAQAMALRPDDRPPSALAMRQALHQTVAAGAPASGAGFSAAAGLASSAGRTTVLLGGPSSAGGPTIDIGAPTALAAPAASRSRLLSARTGLIFAALFTLFFLYVGAAALIGRQREAGQGSVAASAGGGPASAASGAETSRAEPLPRMARATLPGWEVEIVETDRGEEAWRRLYAANQFNDPAPEGYEFVLARLRVRATFNRNERRQLYPQVTGDRQVEYAASRVPPEPALETELNGGETSDGWIAFLVAEEETNLLLKLAELIDFSGAPPVYIALVSDAAVQTDQALFAIDPNRVGVDHREPADLGETAVLEDWEVTLREVVRGAPALERLVAEYDGVEAPAAGREYALAFVELRYIGGEGRIDDARLIDGSTFKSISTNAPDPEGGLIDRPPVYILPEPELTYSVYPGARVSGWVVVELPAGDPEVAIAFSDGYDPNELNTRYFALE